MIQKIMTAALVGAALATTACNTVRGAAKLVANDDMSPLFLATIEATEEAIYNSLFMATAVESSIGKAEPLPLEEVVRILREHRAIKD